MQARIRFTKFGSNTAFGSFQPGDVLRCDASMARHLVEQAGVAVYTEGAPAAVEPAPAPESEPAPAVAPKRRGKAKP